MSGGRKEESSAAGGYPLIAVAVDKDKGSQHALKWAIENLVGKGQTIILVHVNTKTSGEQAEAILKEVMMPFRCFCKRKNIQSRDVLLEDTNIAQAIIDFISQAAVEKLVVGAPSRTGFTRFKISDTPTNISRGAPDFCTVFVISRTKISSVKNAIRSAPRTSSLRAQIQSQAGTKPEAIAQTRPQSYIRGETGSEVGNLHNGRDPIRSPFTRGIHSNTKSYGEIPTSSEADASFTSSGRVSIDRAFQPRFCTAPSDIDRSFEMQARTSYTDSYAENEFSSPSLNSFSSQTIDEVEAEMRRLRLELKQTMDMYSSACREALTAKQKTTELNQWKMEEEQRIHHARQGEEAALAVAEKERAKCKIAIEAAEASKRLAELESQKRINTETNALNESKGANKEFGSLVCGDSRYRRYTIEELEVATENFAEKRKIGEGGYGPVYKCSLDHTPVAVKVLRPDAAQGRSQFQQEVEILSCIRHPSMVLLLGACPEYGCLVYEYMANGSLEDRLFRRGNTPSIPWHHRFRIAAEIGTGLLFLHQTKPEPLVHRDLKPANILLDRNYVSKISDVGLARLVPPSVADNVTQYRMTSAAGTFCYIDPEYQQTGMLGTKSDIYSLGILLLQLVTGKPPMGLTHHVDRAIEKGKFEEMLDPTVPDWPVEEALCLAQMALKCAELRRKDRPDLGTVVLPELKRLRALGEVDMQHFGVGSIHHASAHGHVSMLDVKSGPQTLQSGYESSTSQSNAIAGAERHKSVF